MHYIYALYIYIYIYIYCIIVILLSFFKHLNGFNVSQLFNNPVNTTHSRNYMHLFGYIYVMYIIYIYTCRHITGGYHLVCGEINITNKQRVLFYKSIFISYLPKRFTQVQSV